MRHLIGLSLSFCMRDILKGNLAHHELVAILTSTAFKTPEEAVDYYYLNYWRDYATKEYALDVLTRLWPFIMQPRLSVGKNNHPGHRIGHGFWLDTNTGLLMKSLD